VTVFLFEKHRGHARSAEKETRRVSERIDTLVPAPMRGLINVLLPRAGRAWIKSLLRSAPMQRLDRMLEIRADRRHAAGKRATTANEIRAAFRALPLPEGAVVFVHSSMSRLGYIEGGAEMLVDPGPVTFYHVVEDLSSFPVQVYTRDSPLAAICIDADGRRVETRVMAHDPAASATRIDRPNGVAIRAYTTAALEHAAGLSWYPIGEGRMWLVAARRFYEVVDKLKERSITIYATAAEAARFPSPQSVLSAAAPRTRAG
jgi:hypothetical protein